MPSLTASGGEIRCVPCSSRSSSLPISWGCAPDPRFARRSATRDRRDSTGPVGSRPSATLLLAMATIALEDAVEQPPSQRAARSSRLLWLSCGLIVLWQVGGHVDAWYHTHYGFQIESFLTWPHALLYGSWAATLALVGLSILNRARRPEPAATPHGFRLIFLGVVLFGLGGAFDSMWHALFGFEVRLETLLSPAHLWLVASHGLAVFGVLIAAADHYRDAAAL